MSGLVERKWALGDLVRKKRNSEWRGRVVGFYETENTPVGYNVESLFEVGSAQLWPESALESWDGHGSPEQQAARIRELEGALEKIAKRSAELRQGTDDWFELTEFELAARAALDGEG